MVSRKRLMRVLERSSGGARAGACAARLMACFVLASALAFLGGCSTTGIPFPKMDVAPVVPPRGFIYTHFTAPLVLPDPGMERAKPVSQKSRDVIYVKLMYPDFSGGRADIEDAVRRAGIQRLLYADYEYVSVLGYVRTYNVRAYGYKESVDSRQ